VDYAHAFKELADIHFADAKLIVLGQDNLNTHSKASLYQAFPPLKPDGWLSVSNGTTRPSTDHGSTWQSQSSASCHPNLSPPHPRQTNPCRENQSMGKRAEQKTHQSRLAIQNHRRSRQA
jgi:hypothetical protein